MDVKAGAGWPDSAGPDWTVELVDVRGRRTVIRHPLVDAVVAALLSDGHACSAASVAPPQPTAGSLTQQSEVRFDQGAWTQAEADAAEAVRLARAGRCDVALARALACSSRIQAARGLDESCRANATRALDLAEATGDVEVGFRARLALALLLVGRDDPTAAAGVLERAATTAADLSPGTNGECGAELVEAYVRTGRPRAAEQCLRRLSHDPASYSPALIVAKQRCEALLATTDDRDEAFSRALESAVEHGLPFERARTELCWGESLRRDRRRALAAAPLSSALQTFRMLGASPWVDRTDRELSAATTTPRPRDAPALVLTAQEARVSGAVARGLSNPAIAAELFLSRKTVEYHLGNVFRKLGVHSRTQLTRRLLQALPDAPEGTMEP